MLQKSQGHLGCIPKPVVNMDVSENSGTPKSSILIGFSIINHPFWGTPIFEATYQPPKQLVEFQSPDFSGFFQIWASSLMEIMQDFGEKFPSWHGAQWKIGWSKSRGIFFPSSQKRPKHMLILNKTCHDFCRIMDFFRQKECWVCLAETLVMRSWCFSFETPKIAVTHAAMLGRTEHFFLVTMIRSFPLVPEC